jgi:hypothetical protein
VLVDAAVDVVPVGPDEASVAPVVDGESVVTLDPVGPEEAPVDPVVDGPLLVALDPVVPGEVPVAPVVDGPLVVTPGPLVPDEVTVAPVVDGPLVVAPDPVGPDEDPVAPVVNALLVVTPDPLGPGVPVVVAKLGPIAVEPSDVTLGPVGPVVSDDVDVVVPSAHAVTDSVTSVGPLLSLVFVTFITISVTSSVGNSFLGSDVGCPCIGAVTRPDTVVNVISISSTFLENTRMLRTIAPPLGILIKNEMFSAGKSTPFLIKSVLLEISTGCTKTEFVAIRVVIYSISSQK